jgi:hypothetical protein
MRLATQLNIRKHVCILTLGGKGVIRTEQNKVIIHGGSVSIVRGGGGGDRGGKFC